MTRFIQPNSQRTEDLLTPVSMSIWGRYIEQVLEGYKTVTVAGRETISNVLTTSGEIAGRDGEFVLGSHLPARVITVTYKMRAYSDEDFQFKFRVLRNFLTREKDVQFKFADDPNIVYYGQLADMEEVKPDSNEVFGTFTMYCQDPYKYSDPETELIGTNTLQAPKNPAGDRIREPYKYRLYLTIPAGTSKITVKVTTPTDISAAYGAQIDRQMVFNNAGQIGTDLSIDVNANTPFMSSGKNVIETWDFIASDFKGFTVRPYDVITVSTVPAGTVEIKMIYRERWR